MSTATDIYWDPFDIELDTSPYEMWRRMRDEAPVYYNERYDFFALSRFDDVERAHKDPARFSSAHGITLEIMSPERLDRMTGQMIMTDPPDHTRLRHLVSRAFTPRRITDLEPTIRAICTDLLDEVAGKPVFDYVQDFGATLPSRVISTLVGVPPEDQAEQRRVVDQLFHIEPGVGMINEVSATAGMNLVGYLTELLAEREKSPQDDLASALVQAEITEDGVTRKLTHQESANFALLLYTAGTETVARLLGNTAVVLADHPDERAKLVDDPTSIPSGVEELLRFEAPSPVQGRWTFDDVTLHGETIPKNSKTLLLTGSAGRDERMWPDADEFKVDRKIDHHLSFGYGIHFCVGAALARMEGRIALEETLKRYPQWDVDHANAERLHTSTVRGWKHVPFVVG
jgi:cytochrome P450